MIWVLESADRGLGYEIWPLSKKLRKKLEQETGSESVLFQSDWDWPSLARSLGWDMRSRGCSHSSTDGTVTCRECRTTASEFIARAQEWLDKRVGSRFRTNALDHVGSWV